MIKCIVGLKGHGKTKQLIEMVNEAVENAHGSVICIEKSPKLTYDISHKCRLIDTVDYRITSFQSFYGFLCGLYAQNYDITSVFIDSLYKIVENTDPVVAVEFFENLEALSRTTGVNFVITISAEPDTLPEGVRQYI
ncbi:MAG: hypothetical protein IJL69_07105 [Oscillospiraceae bacterium]|nr:hypothetical protein [Oscillospiraceae bacterium]